MRSLQWLDVMRYHDKPFDDDKTFLGGPCDENWVGNGKSFFDVDAELIGFRVHSLSLMGRGIVR